MPQALTGNTKYHTMTAALIMAGGSGERFWPLSTKEHPKQLLSLFGENSMLHQTVQRIAKRVNPERIFIATNSLQAPKVKQDLGFLPEENIIIEPSFKDTAAAVGYGTYYIRERLENPEIIVLASDHLIRDEQRFIQDVDTAVDTARKGGIVCFGLKPAKPETGYGYIEVTDKPRTGQVYPIQQFHEKPNLETATEYLSKGKFLWNSGMFVFSSQTMVEALQRFLPKHYHILEALKPQLASSGVSLSQKVAETFEEFEKISIDFGIMEKASNSMVICSDFDWHDVGDYNALHELSPKNDNGTTVKDAQLTEINSHHNVVVSNGKRKIGIVGLDNIIVAETEDGLLICDRSQSQEIKKLLT